MSKNIYEWKPTDQKIIIDSSKIPAGGLTIKLLKNHGSRYCLGEAIIDNNIYPFLKIKLNKAGQKFLAKKEKKN